MFLNNLVTRLSTVKNQRGATAVEYGIMVALIAALIIVAVTSIGESLVAAFEAVADALTAAGW